MRVILRSELVRSLTWINKVNQTCQVMQQVILKIRPKAINTSLSGENLVRQDKKEKSEPFMKDEITSTFSHYKNKKSSFRKLPKKPHISRPRSNATRTLLSYSEKKNERNDLISSDDIPSDPIHKFVYSHTLHLH